MPWNAHLVRRGQQVAEHVRRLVHEGAAGGVRRRSIAAVAVAGEPTQHRRGALQPALRDVEDGGRDRLTAVRPAVGVMYSQSECCSSGGADWRTPVGALCALWRGKSAGQAACAERPGFGLYRSHYVR